MMKHVTLLTLLVFAPLSWADEPLMTTPFKCVVDYMGGVNHEKDSQRATKFRQKGHEFRLIPRSNLPTDVQAALFILYEEEIEKFESKDETRGAWETNTYFMREVSSDPSIRSSWEGCRLSSGPDRKNQIVCGAEDAYIPELFRLNLDTKKFVYVYLGTWDYPPFREGHYGDSSVFMFGQCRPYYD